MTLKRGHYGSGTIAPSGKSSWRIRYRINGERFAKTVKGSRTEAARELRRLLQTGDDGRHVEPAKTALKEWTDRWISIGAPGRRRKEVGRRSLERYEQLLRVHVVPALGDKPLQKIAPSDIDTLYAGLKDKISERTALQLHNVLNACLGTAVRKGLLSANPIARAEKLPSPKEADHGMALDDAQMSALLQGFKGSPLYLIVAVAVFTGARRNEIIALRWSDLDFQKNTLSISRSVEETKANGRVTKQPKTERGKRTIPIKAELVQLLRAAREKHLRLVAGIPDGVTVDLSLVKLPPGALMFPGGDGTNLTQLRSTRAVTRIFKKHARKLGFPKLRFHDIRGSHITSLLNKGMPLHEVAARCGHDPAVMLRSYAKPTEEAAKRAAEMMDRLLDGAI